MSKKRVFFIGLMLFSLFFGAGNLIFPPLLGLESGSNFTPAMTGFLVTGVLLPFVAVLAVVTVDGGMISIGSRVHKVFGIVFAIIIYLSIGAFYAIPRAANVAFELGFQPYFTNEAGWPLILFTVLFFAVAYYICLNPKKLVDRVGQLLTPILLVALTILFVRAFFLLENVASPVTEKYTASPFVTGFIEGYFTMDAVAALAFGIVVINAFKDSGVKTKREQIKGSVLAGIIAVVGLAAVYICLGWIGAVMPQAEQFANGAEILTAASFLLFGNTGSLLFSVIVILACFTTCVGLINASASFFHGLYSKVSYKTYVRVLTLVGFVISSLGLSAILDIAVPILVLIYPIAIVLIILSLFTPLIGKGKAMYRISVVLTLFYAIYDVLTNLGFKLDGFAQVIGFVPFFDLGLGWIAPAFVGAVVGYAIDRYTTNHKETQASEKK
ncbi:branched-chain amino acid transport system II carrier protein [Oceanobacillus alkalisoli]|uniref:branched-chain amino acid transport system II carrier protein n=1 Tax=Oceanobacillus alkalisoli TaxID=2925113 RepID=UPI001EF0910A|nr:branched-chain amino acid transport system II carrier protein [Oceanobacillus alkalisoli]MCF3942893.1 branched-chain amino acid transport system II carrier protein [Oceanobacillus alkalisoli]MCG5102367.1 branched-chain amino acid transport system II carrier protein [Oceanobacillus alkalisoli]